MCPTLGIFVFALVQPQVAQEDDSIATLLGEVTHDAATAASSTAAVGEPQGNQQEQGGKEQPQGAGAGGGGSASTAASASAAASASSKSACDDSCAGQANNGVCDEGRPEPKDAAATRADWQKVFTVLCDLGTDCGDCGPWVSRPGRCSQSTCCCAEQGCCSSRLPACLPAAVLQC